MCKKPSYYPEQNTHKMFWKKKFKIGQWDSYEDLTVYMKAY